jgi:hypothetical protein
MPKLKQSGVITRKCLYIGIDPGTSGGLCRFGPSFLVKSPHSYHLRVAAVSSLTLHQIWDWFVEAVEDADQEKWDVKVVIEKVGGFIGTDSTEGPHRNKAAGHTMFKFGASFGALRAFTVAAGFDFEEVLPQTWTKALGIESRNSRKETRTEWKNRLTAFARGLYPKTDITQATADSLLIAEYCRRKWEGGLK